MPKTRPKSCEGIYICAHIPESVDGLTEGQLNRELQTSNKFHTIRRITKNAVRKNCYNMQLFLYLRSAQKRTLKQESAFLVLNNMAFFNSAVGVLQTLVVALGAGLGIWGAINLMEGYGNDNPGAKSQGMKQLMAGGGVALIGTTLVPLLAGLF